MVPDLLDHLRATFNPATGARYDKRFDEIKAATLLILDDLGTESATAWAREKLYQLFNYRYNARLPLTPFRVGHRRRSRTAPFPAGTFLNVSARAEVAPAGRTDR